MIQKAMKTKDVFHTETFETCQNTLTKRDELLFLTVFALPKDSSNGLDFRITSFTC